MSCSLSIIAASFQPRIARSTYSITPVKFKSTTAPTAASSSVPYAEGTSRCLRATEGSRAFSFQYFHPGFDQLCLGDCLPTVSYSGLPRSARVPLMCQSAHHRIIVQYQIRLLNIELPTVNRYDERPGEERTSIELRGTF